MQRIVQCLHSTANTVDLWWKPKHTKFSRHYKSWHQEMHSQDHMQWRISTRWYSDVQRCHIRIWIPIFRFCERYLISLSLPLAGYFLINVVVVVLLYPMEGPSWSVGHFSVHTISVHLQYLQYLCWLLLYQLSVYTCIVPYHFYKNSRKCFNCFLIRWQYLFTHRLH